MTFYVKTDEPAFSRAMITELEKHGLTESKLPASIVFLSGTSAYYKNKIDLKKSDLVNCIHSLKITNKIELHKLFKDYNFIKDFQVLKTRIPILPTQFLKILKPLTGYQGKGIAVVQTSQEIEDWMGKHDYSEWLLQDYIENPALKDGYKFHLRVPILVTKNSAYICKSPFYLAKKPYVKSDWTNPEIHDTHFSEAKYFYPDDLPDGWKRKTDITKMFQKVFEDVSLKVSWNGKTPYYLFGADVMFDGRQPVLLEVNEKIGLKQMEFVIPGMISILLGKDHPDFIQL